MNMVLVEQNTIPEKTSCFGLNENDIKHALHLSHTIKGVAGNCSATELYASARRLESGIKKGQAEKFNSLLSDFEAALNTVFNTAAKLEQEYYEAKAAYGGNGDAKDFSSTVPLLKKLLYYLKENNPEAEACLESIKKQINGIHFSTEMNLLEENMDRLDYKTAEKNLSRMLKEMGIM